MDYDWDEYELFIEIHNDYNLDQAIAKQYTHSGSKLPFEKYKETYKHLKKEFDKEDNEIKDWEQYVKMCRTQGWQI